MTINQEVQFAFKIMVLIKLNSFEKLVIIEHKVYWS